METKRAEAELLGHVDCHEITKSFSKDVEAGPVEIQGVCDEFSKINLRGIRNF